MDMSIEDLDGVLLGINKAQLALDRKKASPGYNLVDHVIQDALVLAGIYSLQPCLKSCSSVCTSPSSLLPACNVSGPNKSILPLSCP
ncbi:hypothetical protein DSO57_1037220 [Entomophthora muscae]|uniref:Uncharacterized protein n=1 Tax=Entomophthora muscae TaxID=34485 RepID=A0ACC2TX78_9FUNG|nr:hypothetical protein DSO57_1037220 [Entomophthora muscae]